MVDAANALKCSLPILVKQSVHALMVYSALVSRLDTLYVVKSTVRDMPKVQN